MTNVQPHQRPTFPWRHAIMLGVVLIVGSTLTLLAGRSHQEHEALLVKEKQTAATQAVVSAFDLELTRTTEAIRNAGLMLESIPNLTRDQFNRYMQKLVTGQLSVSLVEWQPIVPAGALAQFEAAARKEGPSNYRVVQPDASGKGWEPVSGRDTYVPVRFAWPADYKTEGLDMSFSPERMASKLASQRARMPVASAVFPFMKRGMVDSGVKAVAISTTVFDTNNIARSYVAAIVDLPTLFQRAAQVADSVQVDLLVYPGGENSAQPFYTWFGESSDLKQGKVDLGLATAGDPAATVTFGEQAWRVVLHPRTGFYDALPPAHSHLMYASGFGLTLLMLVMLALYLRTNIRLQEQTADLVRSHQSLKEAQRIAQVGNWELDLLTNKLVWSDEIFRIFEIDKMRFGATYEDFRVAIHPEDLDAVNVAYRQSLENRQPYGITYRMQMPDGRIKYVHEHCESFFDANGKPLRSVGTVQDITERKVAEAALQETQTLLTRAEEIGKLGGWEFDIDTMQQTWTKEVYAIHEVDFTGHSTVEQGINFYTPESRPIIEKAVQRAIEHGEPFDLELEIITAKGNLRAVHTIGRHDLARGKIVGFFQDITEHKQAEAMLRASEDRYRRLVEWSPDPILVHRGGKLIYVNPACVKMYGATSAHDLIGKAVFDLIHPDFHQIVVERMKEMAANGIATPSVTLQLFLIDGTTIDADVSAAPIVFDGEPATIVSLRDVTERKRAEAQRRESEKLRRSEQAAALEVQRQAGIAALSLMEDTVAARKQAEAMSTALAEQLDELRRWQQVTLGREGRVLAMKKEVNSLLAERGQPPRYASAADAETET